uniref:Uncharacterized protein n=1 Tax=Tetraselmis sp. GSL018 TaxID=582737 RepID=A0A061S7Z8_9CHLO
MSHIFQICMVNFNHINLNHCTTISGLTAELHNDCTFLLLLRDPGGKLQRMLPYYAIRFLIGEE